MSTGETDYSQAVQTAYDAVQGLKIEEAFKLAGFRLILAKELGVTPKSQVPPSSADKSKQVPDDVVIDKSSWQHKIASALTIKDEQVAELYHLNEDGQIELVIERHLIPDTLVTATKDLAKLLAAGRQAAGTENKTLVSDIRQVIEGQYKVVDKKNFSTSINNLGAKFRIVGKGKERSVELISGAFKLAGDVAKKYLGEEK